MTHNGVTTFTDLGKDPDLFLSEGDYQFDIYRLMKERNKNDWTAFMPYSNILWLHYILRKAIKGVRYKNPKSKVHQRHIKQLQLYESTVLSFSSAREFVCKYF
ncbi:hypothetical protein HUJ05_011514 [Dendroctonus ponderosae]|nr:hypothetical protein HUJ05_011514 [Dendroctonus ponderosae]